MYDTNGYGGSLVGILACKTLQAYAVPNPMGHGPWFPSRAQERVRALQATASQQPQPQLQLEKLAG